MNLHILQRTMSTTFLPLLRHEFHRILHDEGLLIFLLLVPLGYPLLYTFIYTNEVVREVPAIAVELSGSSLGRQFLRQVDATPDVHIIRQASSMDEARQLMQQGHAYGIIYIPTDFDQQLHTGRQAHVSLFCDMSGLLYYKALLMACTDVSLLMNKEIQATLSPSATRRQIAVSTEPVRYESIAFFNPQTGFASFVIPAVLILIIQQTLLLGAGLTAGTDRDRHLPITQAFSLPVLTARATAYLLVTVATSSWMLVAVPHLFRLPQLADAATLALFLLPYLLACILLALLLSRWVREREACMLLFVFTSVPLLFLSGISWPGASIPPFWQTVSWLFPSTFGINGYVRINTMGASLSDVSTEWFALWAQAAIYLLALLFVCRGRKKSRHKSPKFPIHSSSFGQRHFSFLS